MGSLSSRPAVPSAQVVYVPSSAVSSANTSSTATTSSTNSASDQAGVPSGQSASEARTQSLLSRDRGRLGTIKTGFLGLLGAADTKSERKTLLGQ